jgi:VanZ family protein
MGARAIKLGICWWLGLLVLALFLVLPDLVAHPLSDLWMRFPGLDKIIHFLAYAGMFLALYGVLRGRTWPATERGKLGLASVSCMVIALADEARQAFVAGRSSEYGDLVADASGLLLALTWVSANRLGSVRVVAISVLLLVPVGLVTVRTYHDYQHYYRGMAYGRAKDYKAASAEYRRALEKGVRSAALYNELAWIEIEFLNADPFEAGRYAAQAVLLAPRNADHLDTYGWILVKQGKAREGLPLLERAKALKPDIYCIEYHLGVAYSEIGDRERAVEHLRRQVGLNAGDRFGLAARATLKRLDGNAE